MNPEDIKITSLNKLLVYEQQARVIDKMDLDDARNFAKSYCRLYLQQQELIGELDSAFKTL
jgi:hypothetical protein